MGERVLNLYADGACRGNPGEGGAGAVLIDQEGNVVGTVRKFLGVCTNNVAEYSALIIGLEEALKKGCNKLHIFLDSELLVRQVKGVYRVKNSNLKSLMKEVRGLLSSLDGYTIEHIVRDKNKMADRLANEAIDYK
ncbi:MAG: ribonuclease HI family protein [Proteobacteria bacterium]|nr:ribonuclease HI family protein [Pseudomonadota bacterium]